MENETKSNEAMTFKASKKGMKPSLYALVISILSIPILYYIYKPLIKVEVNTSTNDEYWEYARNFAHYERIVWISFFIILLFLIIAVKDYIFNLNTLKIDKNTISLDTKVIKSNQIVSVDISQGIQGAILDTGSVIIRTTNSNSTITVHHRDNPHEIQKRIIKIMEES